MGFSVLVIFNFFGNKIYTFQLFNSKKKLRLFIKYLVYVIFYYILTILIIDFLRKFNINFYFIMFLATIFLVFLNFLIQKFYIFNKS